MRNLLLLGALASIGMFAADNTPGTWKLNVAKSKSTAANPVVSQTDVREATADGGFKLTRTSQLKDGTPVNYTASCKYDGKECAVKGAPYDVVSSKRIDDNTTTFETKKAGGKYQNKGKNVVSKDGKTLTQTITGTDAEGKTVKITNVFERQ